MWDTWNIFVCVSGNYYSKSTFIVSLKQEKLAFVWLFHTFGEHLRFLQNCLFEDFQFCVSDSWNNRKHTALIKTHTRTSNLWHAAGIALQRDWSKYGFFFLCTKVIYIYMMQSFIQCLCILTERTLGNCWLKIKTGGISEIFSVTTPSSPKYRPCTQLISYDEISHWFLHTRIKALWR